MTPEKWENIKGNILDNFEIEDKGTEHLPDEGGVDIDYIVFFGPIGKMRLEFVTKPVVLDKKTLYSNRIGSETKVEYVYSAVEKNQQLMVYKWESDVDDWVEMDAGIFDK